MEGLPAFHTKAVEEAEAREAAAKAARDSATSVLAQIDELLTEAESSAV